MVSQGISQGISQGTTGIIIDWGDYEEGELGGIGIGTGFRPNRAWLLAKAAADGHMGASFLGHD